MEPQTEQVSSSKLRSVVEQYMASRHFPSHKHPALQAIADSELLVAGGDGAPPPDYDTANSTSAVSLVADEDDEVKVPL